MRNTTKKKMKRRTGNMHVNPNGNVTGRIGWGLLDPTDSRYQHLADSVVISQS